MELSVRHQAWFAKLSVTAVNYKVTLWTGQDPGALLQNENPDKEMPASPRNIGILNNTGVPGLQSHLRVPSPCLTSSSSLPPPSPCFPSILSLLISLPQFWETYRIARTEERNTECKLLRESFYYLTSKLPQNSHIRICFLFSPFMRRGWTASWCDRFNFF